MDAKVEELTAIIQGIRERVRAGRSGADGQVALADLMPLLRARDAAEGKVAAIGTVNPRPPGFTNNIAQWFKRLVARALDWHVREQVEFNRGVMQCVQATLDALNETNRAIAALNAREAQAGVVQDLRDHWTQWRAEWEGKLSQVQIQFLRSLSDLQGAWQHRVTLQDEQHRERVLGLQSGFESRMRSLHGEYEVSLNRANEQLQARFWADLEKIRREYEGLIHAELRLVRQKATLVREGSPVASPAALDSLDWLKFAEKFRGKEEYVHKHLHIYAERFAGADQVLDIGCGRGELLEALKSAKIGAWGIDLNDDCVAMCRTKGLQVEKADLFPYLEALPSASLGGVALLQVVEHIPPPRLPELIALAHAKLRQGALIAIETPNPECLAIFAKHFYLDPTHQKPVPHALAAFYLEEAGFGRLETLMLEPAEESMPSLNSLPEAFRKEFFGPLDYAIFGRKL